MIRRDPIGWAGGWMDGPFLFGLAAAAAAVAFHRLLLLMSFVNGPQRIFNNFAIVVVTAAS